MELNSLFEQAVLQSKALPQKPANDVLLKLYALYKQATHGDIDTDAPANAFDFVARAKHNAWDTLKGTAIENAKQEYINLVNSLK
jgi:diazepam-binding inhibitor (GABA receptor modulator, acyl-CoA-binding protein)